MDLFSIFAPWPLTILLSYGNSFIFFRRVFIVFVAYALESYEITKSASGFGK